jgi:hypothetical protein
MRSANSRVTTLCIRPLEEGDGCARATEFITKIDMIGEGIIEIDGQFDEPQSKHTCVEIDRSLDVGAS